jgi:hypothetical protein
LGAFALPDGNLQTLDLSVSKNKYVLKNDFLAGKVKWTITHLAAK